jgi:hypothetical protein
MLQVRLLVFFDTILEQILHNSFQVATEPNSKEHWCVDYW